MVKDGYFIVRFTDIGTGVLSAKINNLFERLMFLKKENADRYMEMFNKNKDLTLYHVLAYTNNKVMYEEHQEIIDSIGADDLMVV